LSKNRSDALFIRLLSVVNPYTLTAFFYISVMNLNKEEILFFVSSVIFLILSVFTEYVNDLIIVILLIMLIWMNRIIRKRNKS